MSFTKRLPDDWEDIITWNNIIDGISCCKKITCGGKPPTLRSRIKGHGDKYWIFKKANNGGYPQLLVDKLKPLFGLSQMKAARFWGDFSIDLIGKTQKDKASKYTINKIINPIPYLVFPESKGRILNTIKNWKDNESIMFDYLVIGMWRWGSVRATDFNGCNVMLLDNNKLLSIDEMEIEKRKKILGNNDKKINQSMIENKDKLIDICGQWVSSLSKRKIVKIVIDSGYSSEKADWIINNINNLEKDLSDQIKNLKNFKEKSSMIKSEIVMKNDSSIKNSLEKILENVKVSYKYRVGKTFHDFDIGSVKSALQKSIRRGKVEDAMAYGIELWLFVNDKNNPSGGDGVVTNLVNRLHIIISEDVGMGNLLLPSELKFYFENLDKPKNNNGPFLLRRTPEGLKNLLTIIKHLCDSKHSRLMSLLITPYMKLHYFDKLLEKFPNLYNTPDMKIKDPQKAFLTAIEIKSPTSVYHAAKLYNDDSRIICRDDLLFLRQIFVRKRKFEIIYWIWDKMCIMSKNLPIHDSIVELCKLYDKKHHERRLYIVHAILLLIKWKSNPVQSIKPFSVEESLSILKNHIKNKMNDIPDIYKDMHTFEGLKLGYKKKNKKGINFFLQTGMYIENPVECNFDNFSISEKNLLDCYVWSKLNLDLNS